MAKLLKKQKRLLQQRLDEEYRARLQALEDKRKWVVQETRGNEFERLNQQFAQQKADMEVQYKLELEIATNKAKQHYESQLAQPS